MLLEHPPMPDPDFSEPVVFAMGVLLRPRTEREPAYVVDRYDPPRGIPGVEPGPRSKKGSSRDLEKAYTNACRAAEQLLVKVERLLPVEVDEDSRLRAGACWQDVLSSYLDPALHTRWTDGAEGSYAKQQRSLAANWLGWVPPGEERPVRRVDVGGGHEFRALPVAGTAPSHLVRATDLAFRERSYNTYANVAKLVRSLIVWAGREAFMEVADADRLLKQFEARPAPVGEDGLTKDQIPTLERVLAFREAHGAHRFGPRREWLGELEADLPAWCGLRLGELLAIQKVEGQFVELEDSAATLRVFKRVTATGKLAAPKWRKVRFVTIPAFLTASLQRAWAETAEGRPLFPSPTGKLYGTRNWQQRQFDRTVEALREAAGEAGRPAQTGWPELDSYCVDHREADPACCEGNNRRRWLWTAHSLRHFAVTWTLLPRASGGLGWYEEDAAEHFGHRNAAQLRDLYQEVLPRRFERRAQASAGVNPLAG